MKVTIVCEHNESMDSPEGKRAYPNGMGECLKEFLSKDRTVTALTYDDKDCGAALTDEILENTDVLVWWGHWYHGSIPDVLADKIAYRVQRGMGIIFLHSAHDSKVIKRLLGTSCRLEWREAEERELLWAVTTAHPITEGVPAYVDIPCEEMYGEAFDIPTPDELIFIGWFEGGNVFRGGAVFNRGRGKIFYFQPGHETYPTYYLPDVRRIIANAVDYVAPRYGITDQLSCPCVEKIVK